MMPVVVVEVVGGVLAYWVGAVAIATALGRLDAVQCLCGPEGR
jgi:hypothetical protein